MPIKVDRGDSNQRGEEGRSRQQGLGLGGRGQTKSYTAQDKYTHGHIRNDTEDKVIPLACIRAHEGDVRCNSCPWKRRWCHSRRPTLPDAANVKVVKEDSLKEGQAAS